MKMRKLLSIGALTLTLITCTSMSAFASESLGDRKEAAKSIAVNAWKGNNVINNVEINSKTSVNKYVKQALIDKIITCVNDCITDKELAKKVTTTIQDMYDKGKSSKEIFEELSEINDGNDITNDETFKAAKVCLKTILGEFETVNQSSDNDLIKKVNEYFKTDNYGTLTVGRNSNNRKVVTLQNNSGILLQVSSENVYNLQGELENKIHSWGDLKTYFSKIQ